jgi:hypothetical protein
MTSAEGRAAGPTPARNIHKKNPRAINEGVRYVQLLSLLKTIEIFTYSTFLFFEKLRTVPFNDNKNYLATISEKENLSKKIKRIQKKKTGWLADADADAWLAGSHFSCDGRCPEPGSRHGQNILAFVQHSARACFAEADACVQLVCCKKV